MSKLVHRLRIPRLALLALLPAAAAQAQESAWTPIEPSARSAPRTRAAGLDPRGWVLSVAPMDEIERAGLTLTVEGPPTGGPDDALVARRGLSPEGGGWYYGAGVGLDDFGDGLAAARLVGGAAAPLADGAILYGEYQHLRSLPGGATDDRVVFGLRHGF